MFKQGLHVLWITAVLQHGIPVCSVCFPWVSSRSSRSWQRLQPWIQNFAHYIMTFSLATKQLFPDFDSLAGSPTHQSIRPSIHNSFWSPQDYSLHKRGHVFSTKQWQTLTCTKDREFMKFCFIFILILTGEDHISMIEHMLCQENALGLIFGKWRWKKISACNSGEALVICVNNTEVQQSQYYRAVPILFSKPRINAWNPR